MLTLKKEDAVKELATISDISEAEAKRRLDASLLAMANCLSTISESEPDDKGVRGKLAIVGFGNFVVKARKGRYYRNPQGGPSVSKPDSNDVKLKPGKFLKDSVN